MEAISCPPVSAAERAAAQPPPADAASLSEGWFGVCAAGSDAGGRSTAAEGGYAWQVAERLYTCQQYALAFQLALAPEVGEEELASLGPEWVQPETLMRIQVRLGHPARECGALRSRSGHQGSEPKPVQETRDGPVPPPVPQEDALDVALMACSQGVRRHASTWRLRRTLQSVLVLSTQLQDAMGVQRSHQHAARVANLVAQLQ